MRPDRPSHRSSPRPTARAGAAGQPVIGWREWVSVPDFGVPAIKAKIDTGARSSTLHAFGLRYAERDGVPWVQFQIHPIQRSRRWSIDAAAPIADERAVRSSNGGTEHRPVIVAVIELAGVRVPIELTLTNRDDMGFRMLLGREAVRRRFLVDPGRSYLAGLSDEARAMKRQAAPLPPAANPP